MRRFVPMSDDLLYRDGGLPGRLVPYRVGLDCWHALGADGIYHFEDAPGEAIAELSSHAPIPSVSAGLAASPRQALPT